MSVLPGTMSKSPVDATNLGLCVLLDFILLERSWLSASLNIGDRPLYGGSRSPMSLFGESAGRAIHDPACPYIPAAQAQVERRYLVRTDCSRAPTRSSAC